MINHSSDQYNTVLSVLGDDENENDDNSEETEEEQLYYAVIAARNIQKGEELLISYGSGEDTSLELLLHYGFVPDQNPYDVDFMAWEASGEDDSNDFEKCWTTTLEDDEQQLKKDSLSRTEQTILQFRIRMKRAYKEYQALSNQDGIEN